MAGGHATSAPMTGCGTGAAGLQASTVTQPLVQAMCLANTVEEVAAAFFIHPAPTEVVGQALLEP